MSDPANPRWPGSASGRGGAANLRTVDLNLLVVFQALVEERSAAQAADRLGVSPSAVSHALRRLRDLFNEELFVRNATGLTPTPLALELAEDIGASLAGIEAVVGRRQRFDPQTSRRTFTIQVADYVSGFLLPSLAARLGEVAPSVSIVVVPFETRGEPGAVPSLVIRLADPHGEPEGTRFERLMCDDFVVLMRADHPAAEGDWSVERYASLRHLKVSAAAVGSRLIDERLADRGLTRHVVMTIPTRSAIASVVANSDLVAAVPRRWYEREGRFGPFRVRPLPLEEVMLDIVQCWEPRHDRQPAERWLRRLVTEIFAAQAAGEAEGGLRRGEGEGEPPPVAAAHEPAS